MLPSVLLLVATTPPHALVAPAPARSAAELRAQVVDGLEKDAGNERRDASLRALDELAPSELDTTMKLLEGRGGRANLIASDGEVRLRFFRRLARDTHGQRVLVDAAVRDDGAVQADAYASLEAPLSDEATAAVRAFLASDRELHVNRAAMVGSAFAPALMIPELIQAQSAPPRRTRGDEAWIALGKSTTYVGNVIPTVGDGSAAFQPVPATVFEGSVFRVSDSVVTIYRTEVHRALVSAVERTTGEPAPAFGIDEDRWMAWYRSEYPVLAARAEARARERAAEQATSSRKATDEG